MLGDKGLNKGGSVKNGKLGSGSKNKCGRTYRVECFIWEAL